ARVRNDEVPDDVRRRAGETGCAGGGERGVGAAVQDQERPARDSGRPLPAALLDRRAAAGAERPLGRDVARRAAAAADPRLRAARAVATQPLFVASGYERTVASYRPD